MPKNTECDTDVKKQGSSSSESEESSEDEEVPAKRPFLPGISADLAENEELEVDMKAYRMYYQVQMDIPSLSFDIIHDNLGESRILERGGPPIKSYLVLGSQAKSFNNNQIQLLKLSNMRPLKELTSTDSDSDSELSDDETDDLPNIEAVQYKHKGSINRIRCNHLMDKYFAAVWSESGKVSIWELSSGIQALNDGSLLQDFNKRDHHKPTFISSQKKEGFALDWSKPVPGRFASGDIDGNIFIFDACDATWSCSKPYTGHTAAVEDIQWSPTEATVFISCSTDKSIRVWDSRNKSHRPMVDLEEAHSSDVNVCSWNRIQSNSLLSGGDDGSLRVWDLRMCKQSTNVTKSVIKGYTHLFEYHKKPITSVEWHPEDAGVFAASSEDNQISLWDMNLEQDADEDQDADQELKQIPVQLMFIHCGQEDIKEIHWHRQIPGLLISTALDGLNVFRTINI
ncbi:Glutamate-rich WD repeat-containing protein 1 [Cichlidogyrus casuarinus]|uniref:Glutamate-rich WD repeat-containing protein 1 n=1 Tax=Cichlidogyrus casuarinus TaxID=1844966 RepID=A0ABD2QKI8_9PLAT